MLYDVAKVRLKGFWKRRKQQLKNHILPFNLKEASRAPRGHLTRVLAYPKLGWVGPWVSLWNPLTNLGVSRLHRYTFNTLTLWLACPARGGLNRQQTSWLGRCLRGLTGLVSMKLRFKGKSFRWHRRRQALVLRFGHSHLVTCTPPLGTKWKRGSKTKMLFFNSNWVLLREYLRSVVAWREPNRYHSRGLRLSRQKLTRKAGKVSAYR